MCGIAGVLMLDGSRPCEVALGKMADAMGHRGPDGKVVHIDGALGLVHTRLAIVDLISGDQPLGDPHSALLIANAEIYNDFEVRKGRIGTNFLTNSDCESALRIFEVSGIRFADFLRGMYALAIYDKDEKILILSRDPFGIKPLYYCITESKLCFASEPQTLIQSGLVEWSPASKARAELLQLKFTTGRETIFSSIQRVLPGETMVVKADGKITRIYRQALPDGAPSTGVAKRNFSKPEDKLDELLSETVLRHVRADVPIGLFLSGGIDSAAIAALMTRVTSQRTWALTVGFPGFPSDETAAATKIAKATGAEHHVLQMTGRDFWAIAPKVAAIMDDPTTDAAALPMYLMGQAAGAAGRKVMLSGAGADELFAGYGRYRKAAWLGRLARSRTKPVFKHDVSGRFDGWREGLASVASRERGGGRSQIQTLQATDCAEWLPNDVLLMLDRCLMAHGVEGRTPFLDPAIAKFAFELPNNLKVHANLGKWILRRWLAQNLPEADAYAKKSGFVPPVGKWISEASPSCIKLISEQPGILDVFEPDFVRQTLESAPRNPQMAWSLMYYSLWHSHHVLGVSADGSVDEILAEAARRA